ncbi:MAG: type I DNA topoisomerase [Pyramidobacter sp.]|nr:type I DNA topoisomerase [Pyramidobacter sp.]
MVVESPTKARSLTKILGSSYTVKASVGHIVDLPKSRLAIDIEHDFKPEYILVKGKAKIKKELQTAAASARTVLLAADPDREGEAIAWHVSGILGIDPASDCRIRIHEITADAVKNAVKHPEPIDMNRVNAQQARRVLDRLVGYQLSPLLWRKVRRGLSAGRVQSVALAIICQREDEISAFVPKDYWNICVDACSPDGRHYRLRVERENNVSLLTDGKPLAIDSLEKAQRFENVLRTEPIAVAAFTQKNSSRKAPVPFKTSTLQQAAASRLGFSPRRTMSVAQSLFEGVVIPSKGVTGLITYMRTDSLRMAPEAVNQARSVIKETFGSKYIPAKPIMYHASSNAQDAHEAIRPTDFTLKPELIKSALSPEQYRLYDLIWRRSIASQMTSAKVNSTAIECQCANLGLRAQGSSVSFDGWGAVWPLDLKDSLLSPAQEGEILTANEIETEQNQTRPPLRYTESSLIKTLEEDGIGRPSTYASIVETLYDRAYVVREEDRKLRPSELGRIVNRFLLDHFSSESASPIVNVGFTAAMESSLDEVESGKSNWVDLVGHFWKTFSDAIEEAEKAPAVPLPPPELTGELCPECGRPLVKKRSRFGEFIGCSGFPECRYIQPLQKKIGVPCPKCGADEGGEVVQKKSKKGRTFFSCSRYPDCDFVSWNKPSASKCPVCGAVMEYRGRARTPVCPQCGHKGEE